MKRSSVTLEELWEGFVIGVLICIAFAFATTGCGGGWVPADAKSATDSVHAQMMIEQMCSDAGQCVPSQVRALERSALCGNLSMLSRHGQAVPEAGVQCQPL